MIQRWDIVTIGNLSRNPYWGESADKSVRSPLCTSTLLIGANFRLLVDPPIADEEKMRIELARRTGLAPEDVTHVFLTHAHGDHHTGMRHFPAALWLAAAPVAVKLNGLGRYEKAVEDARKDLPVGLGLLHTPGHTLDHHSLRFECEGRRVLVAGDAVMTRDFWRDRKGYFNSEDLALAATTIETLAGMADVVIPGHDNYLLA